MMKELHELETNQEKLRLQNIEESNDLLHRYRDNKSISLVKRK